MLKPFLDSSAIVKRYVTEPGSSAVDFVFDKAEGGETYIATSVWNIGEVLGVLDERRRRGWLSEDEFKKALESFASETVKLLRLRILEVLPVPTPILVGTWPLILSEHIYEADAIQVQTCIYCGGVLLSGDKGLINVALRKGLNAVNVEDEDKVKDLLSKIRNF